MTTPSDLDPAEKLRLLDLVLRTTEQGFWFVDPQGVTTDLNPAMCRLLGRPRDEVVGRRAQSFFSGDDQARVEQGIADRSEGRSGRYEAVIVRPDGSRRHCMNHATPIADAAGRHAGSVGIWTDVTELREAEASLRLYEAVTNSITDPVSVVDDQQHRTYRMVNDAWCRTFGFEREQVLGRRAGEVFPASVSSKERNAAVQRCLDLVRPQRVRATVDLPGLRGALLETTYYPFDGQGAPSVGGGRLVVIVTRDVSEQEAAAQRVAATERELRAVLDAAPGYIHAVDDDFRYVYMNQRLASVLGVEAGDVIGRHVRDVLGEERFLRNAAEIEQARAGGLVTSMRSFLIGTRRERLDIELTLVAGPVRADGRRTFYGFGTDVSARKRAEESLVAARDDAERANRAKSTFLAHMSHELRTPLNAVIGFAQLLDMAVQPPLPAAQRAQVHEILRGGRHLLDLINDLLDLGRIEAGEMSLASEAVDLAEPVRECLALLQPLAHERQLTLHLLDLDAGQAVVHADRKRLGQVLLNLISNAVKYNRPGGQVWVSARAEADAVRVEVRDTGLGLSEAQQQRLFQPFERLDAADSGVEGTGIGLAISRHLAAMMGGRIGVRSVVGEGSTFWVQLPRAGIGPDEAAAPAPAAIAAAAASSTASVLCVEDNAINLMLLQAMLDRLGGWQVLSASSASEGLQLARDHRPDLVLTDIVMPGLDGFELLRRLRADPSTRDIPVIAVSASAMPGDIEAGRAAGFQDYLTKPLDLTRLAGAIERALAHEPHAERGA